MLHRAVIVFLSIRSIEIITHSISQRTQVSCNTNRRPLMTALLQVIFLNVSPGGLCWNNSFICKNLYQYFNLVSTEEESRKVRHMVEEQTQSMNLNAVRLCFQAYLPDDGGCFTKALPPCVSNPVYDSSEMSLSILFSCYYF